MHLDFSDIRSASDIEAYPPADGTTTETDRTHEGERPQTREDGR